jgi:hypothetical protein
LHTREELERIKPARQRRERPPALSSPRQTEPDFLPRATPWVDFSLASFHLEDRVGNFLNLGVQVGGYFFERLRLSARLVTPLEGVSDGYSSYGLPTNGANGQGAFQRVDARSMTLLYGVTAGLVIANSRSFVFGPSVELLRTDVEAYGSTLAFGLPFEWTTRRDLRVGFELALGHSFGGSVQQTCRTFTTPALGCGNRTVDRPSGTAVLFQFNMGWALGSL